MDQNTIKPMLLLALLGILLQAHEVTGQAHTALAERVIILASAVPERSSREGSGRVFFSGTVVIEETVTQALLASTADGRGTLCTDDQATIVIQARAGETHTWSQSYASPDRQQIVCQEPQMIAFPDAAGPYTVTITLEDLYGPKYGSRPYMLLFETAAVQATGSAVLTAPPHPSVSPTPIATLLPISPTTIRTYGSAARDSSTAPNPRASSIPRWMLVGFALAGLALLLVLLRRVGRRPHTPRLHGIADLIDQETGEIRTFLLGIYPHGAAVVRRPLDLIAWPADQAARPPLVTIVPTQQGPLLTLYRAGLAEEAVPLRAGERIQLDRQVELRFRN